MVMVTHNGSFIQWVIGLWVTTHCLLCCGGSINSVSSGTAHQLSAPLTDLLKTKFISNKTAY